MLAISPLFFVTATALLLAAYTSAAPFSHSSASSTEGVTPTLFRPTDPTTHRILTEVAKDRAPNPGEKDFRPTTDRFPTVVAKDHALNLGKKDINPITHPITTPGEKDTAQSKPDVSPTSAKIQYHTVFKREVLGPFLYAPLVPSSFDIAAEEWNKKKKHNGQVQLDNSLNMKAKEGRKKIEGEAKG